MRLIGYWIRSLDDDAYIPPQELVTEYDAESRNLIANYLEEGSVFAQYRGLASCRFFCKGWYGSRELTDGEWVWPEGLSHYVRVHSVRLPEQFGAKVREANSRPGWSRETLQSLDGDTLYARSPRPDVHFWKSWCRQNRSGKYQEAIRIARAQADQEAAQIKSKMIAERERKEGLSTIPCQWKGCTNLALKHRALCASCATHDWSIFTSRPYHNLRALLET